ncbi:MAG: hypothetical protein IT384_20505 [Deltaproteobacteria bacterium]|nr:hypothetical protein [Deltaproteobacteria bacterium]
MKNSAETIGYGLLVLLGASLGGVGCTRPVDGRSLGAAQVTRLEVTPRFIRAGVPIQIDFRVSGALPSEVSFEIASVPSACEPEQLGDGRYRCTHPGIDATSYGQGATLVTVQVTDEQGRKSIATQPVTIDFECPRIAALVISSGARTVTTQLGERVEIAAPGNEVVLNVEASEELVGPPQVTRNGRPWSQVVGGGRSFTVRQLIGDADPSAPAPIVVRISDLAGNTSGDCADDGHLLFAVDHLSPLVDLARITVERDAPGVPSTITASTGAFLDDVAIREVHVLDETGTLLLATLVPEIDGSIPLTNLRVQPASRVLIEAIDHLDRSSGRVAVTERWRLSIGNGATPGAALRTAIRYSPAPAETASMNNATIDLASRVLAPDGLTAEVRAHLGFELAGVLPNSYEDRFEISAAYDRTGGAVVIFGGGIFLGNNSFDFSDRTLILRWREAQGAYSLENGPAPAYGQTPPERRGAGFTFDGSGCGVLFAGDGAIRPPGQPTRFGFLRDVWRICRGAGGYRWEAILPENGASYPTPRIGGLSYDPVNRRYLVVQGESQAFSMPLDDVLFLEPDVDPAHWRWTELSPLPANFNARRGHVQFWDPRIEGFVIGLGLVQPYGSGEERLIWTYQGGQWSAAQVPAALSFREGAGYAFDEARRELVLWGGGESNADGRVWLMTKTSSNGVNAWRGVDLDAPLPRHYPTLVYDADREATLMFGGVRTDRFIPPDVYALHVEPSWPDLQATVALGAARPPGIVQLSLRIDAHGTGDADGTGPGQDAGTGFQAMLWDYNRARWEPVGEATDRLVVELRDAPDRFVSSAGRISLSLRSKNPATELLDAALVVDAIDGALLLESGVTLPGS